VYLFYFVFVFLCWCVQNRQMLQKSDYFCMDALYLHDPASDENQCEVSSVRFVATFNF